MFNLWSPLVVCLHHIIGHLKQTDLAFHYCKKLHCWSCVIYSFPNSFILWCFYSFSSLFPNPPFSYLLSGAGETGSRVLSDQRIPVTPFHASWITSVERKKEAKNLCIHVPVYVVYVLYAYAEVTIIFVMLLEVHSSERTSLITAINISTLYQEVPLMTQTWQWITLFYAGELSLQEQIANYIYNFFKFCLMLHKEKWNHTKRDKRIYEFLSSWCRFNGVWHGHL